MSRRLRMTALVLTSLVLLAPTATALGAGAETITVRERQLDVNPGEYNPCSDTTGTIIDDEQDVFHITALADGAQHLTGHSTVTVTFVPDDPNQVTYQGHETFAFSENSNRRAFATTTTSHVRVRGTDGTFLTIRDITHLTVTQTTVTASFDKPTFICS